MKSNTAFLRILIFVLLALCSILSPLFSASTDTPLATFQQANQLYEKGDYTRALELYQSLARDRQANAALYYNLGNAYYRLQQPGRALVNFERALRLAPRDADIRQNLAFVRQAVKEPVPSFADQVISGVNGLISLNGLTLLCSFFYVLLIAGIVTYLFRRSQWLLAANICLLLVALLFGGWLLLKVDQEAATRWAIVVAGPAEVRNGPGSENSIGFTLPEGRKIVVLGEKDDWIAIGLKAEGLKGWVEKKYIEEI